ncbi:hypothetical protein HAX54_044194, partial [Datura stramonium]|nr:hypothetical protein [Datura stramonium]
AIMDDDTFEWEMEEEVVGETIAYFFLKGEKLEESVTHPAKRRFKAQTTAISTSVPGSGLDIGFPSGKTSLCFENHRLFHRLICPCCIPPEPTVLPSQPEARRSPLDDWWVGYNSTSEIVSDEELYHRRPSPPPMLSVYELNPSWTPSGVAMTSYHKLCTLLEKWVVPRPNKLFALQRTREHTQSSK